MSQLAEQLSIADQICTKAYPFLRKRKALKTSRVYAIMVTISPTGI